MDDRHKRAYTYVANNKEEFADLKYNTAGRNAWYLSLKGDIDPDWEHGTIEG